MTDPMSVPNFHSFLSWLARREADLLIRPSTLTAERLLAAAREARDETLQAQAEVGRPAVRGTSSRQETLQLLAAATPDDAAHPLPELTTARGFRVTLAYDEGDQTAGSSLCVLVRCPPALIDPLQGKTAWLWNGSERFELGQFDAEGKAIGTLPAGIEITLTDFSQGRVTLEGPDTDR